MIAVLIGYLAAVAASLGAWWLVHRRQRGVSLLSDRPFSGHDLAVLGGGAETAVDLALASLQEGGHVVRRGPLYVWTGPVDDEADPHPYRGDAPDRTIHPAEQEVVAALRTGPRTRVQLVRVAARRARAVERSLARGGWMVYDWQRRSQALWARLPVLLVSAVGLVGSFRWPIDEVTRLILFAMSLGTAGLGVALPRHPRVTPRGHAALQAAARAPADPEPS